MNLRDTSLADLSRALDAGEVSSEEITRAYLERIDRYNSRVNAFIDVFEMSAIEEARKSDAERADGRGRGALHGLPVAVKDIIDIKGSRTTAGSILLPQSPASQDAEVIRRLRDAGVVFLGKLNLHEFAWGGTTRNIHYGDGSNPWKEGYSPGGSSGGSAAAVVAGLAAAALGTDTLGSVRIPASYCGCVGLKTTYGAVSNRGVYPLAWSLDSVGPIVRCTEDAALMFRAMSGADPLEPTSRDGSPAPFSWEQDPSVRGLKLGVIRNETLAHDGSAEEREVEACVRTALEHLESLGAKLMEVELPEWNEARSIVMKIALAEASAVHETHLKDAAEKIGEDVRQRLELGQRFSGPEIARAYRQAVEVRHSVRSALEDVDAIVLPSTATTAHAFDPQLAVKTAKYTAPVNLLGWPAVSVPCGFSDGGLPVGLQIVTPSGQEMLALRIARAYEASTEWAERRPPGFEV